MLEGLIISSPRKQHSITLCDEIYTRIEFLVLCPVRSVPELFHFRAVDSVQNNRCVIVDEQRY